MRELRIANNLTALCLIHNKSVENLSKETGISKNMIWYYKRGIYQPTLYNTGAIADAFNITIDDLCYGEYNLSD